MDRCSLAPRTGLQVDFARRTAIQGEQKRAALKTRPLSCNIGSLDRRFMCQRFALWFRCCGQPFDDSLSSVLLFFFFSGFDSSVRTAAATLAESIL